MSVGMVIVGAGESGVRAAVTLREQGYTGPVTLIGSEQGLPYERPPLSKSVITTENEPCAKTLLTLDRAAALSIDLITGNGVVRVDRQQRSVVLADGSSVPYQKLLLATGSVPRRMPKAPPSVAYLRTFDDALFIRSRLRVGSRVVIVGGGFIGLELAASARMRGATVTVLEVQPRLLMRGVPEMIASSVHARHAAAGVNILCGHGIAGIAERDTTVTVRTAQGGEIEADLCVIGIGAIPVTELAVAAGLAVDNGIAVDDSLRSSDPNIFAAGDCCSVPLAIYDSRRTRLESWRSAQEHGMLAAKNMLGGDHRHMAVPWFWSDQYDMTLYVAGLHDESQSIVRRNVAEGTFLLFHLADDGRLVAASGVGPGNTVAKDIRLAEMLIARRARPVPEQLMAPDFKLRALLSA